jgi:hypothetical protein
LDSRDDIIRPGYLNMKECSCILIDQFAGCPGIAWEAIILYLGLTNHIVSLTFR